MSDFFITWSERLIIVFVVLLMLCVLGGSFAAASDPSFGAIPAILLFLCGILYVTFIAGFMFVAFGIFRNTQKTNKLLEELLRK